jgi:16S rRNA U516 pseudouridylate synthase RsuA-like enzyme
MKTYTLYLAEAQIRQLKALSKRTGLKVSELMRRFIDEGLRREAKRATEQH